MLLLQGGIKMTKFIHWVRLPEFPFTHIDEDFEVDIVLDEAWEEVKKILHQHGFAMQEHFDGAFVAFPFGESAEETTEAWEGWEV